MPRQQHDAVLSLPEFWRTLTIVAIGFGMLLAVSWAIDAIAAHADAGVVAGVHAAANPAT